MLAKLAALVVHEIVTEYRKLAGPAAPRFPLGGIVSPPSPPGQVLGYDAVPLHFPAPAYVPMRHLPPPGSAGPPDAAPPEPNEP